jgi:hypothetical protein
LLFNLAIFTVERKGEVSVSGPDGHGSANFLLLLTHCPPPEPSPVLVVLTVIAARVLNHIEAMRTLLQVLRENG